MAVPWPSETPLSGWGLMAPQPAPVPPSGGPLRAGRGGVAWRRPAFWRPSCRPPGAAAVSAERTPVVGPDATLYAAKLLAVLVFALWSAVLAWAVVYSELED